VATLDDADLRAKLVERGTERIHAMSIDKYAANLRRILDEVPGRRS
jgi:hypothetical protein